MKDTARRLTSRDGGAILWHCYYYCMVQPQMARGDAEMNFARVGRFVVRCRRRMSEKGCRGCKKVLSYGLFLRGEPQLTEMARSGATVLELKTAMRERGWFCRACVNRRNRVPGAEGSSLRDQFDTQEEYYAWLEKSRPNVGTSGGYLDKQAKETAAATTTTASLVGSPSPGPGPGN